MMKIVQLQALNDEAWAYMPKFLRRVSDFAVRYTPEEDILAQAFSVVAEFSLGQGNYFGAVLVDDSEYELREVYGHALWSLDTDELGKRKWVTIHQVEIDKDAPMSAEERKLIAFQFIDLITAFALKFEAQDIRLLALSLPHARYYKRYGFDVFRYLMVKPVTKGDANGINLNNVS